jgi:hypothetical protein
MLVTIPVKVAEENVPFFEALLKELDRAVPIEKEIEVPLWMQEDVLRRQAETKPEEYTDWDELEKKYSGYGI